MEITLQAQNHNSNFPYPTIGGSKTNNKETWQTDYGDMEMF